MEMKRRLFLPFCSAFPDEKLVSTDSEKRAENRAGGRGENWGQLANT